MKLFKQTPVKLNVPHVTKESVLGHRFYFNQDNPDSGPYPSVTSVLKVDPEKEASLELWRERIGHAEATKISRAAACRGNMVHLMMEHYVQNEPDEGHRMPDALDVARQLRQLADKHVDNIRCVEQYLWSDYLRVAGTVDLVADWDGVISIIDWKNSAKKKNSDWIEDYFIQKAAYAVMFEECSGIPVERLVTVVGVLGGVPQVFINKRDAWIDKFIQYRSMFDQALLEKSATA